MAIFIVALVILITLLALAYMFYTFSNNFCIFASNYESAELTKTNNTEKE